MPFGSDEIILCLVVAVRLLAPLLIPRYPLPAILAALIVDAADQSILQQFTEIPLDNYQGYDKALDTYYLTFAYVASLRNWSNRFAAQVSHCLFYWRLVGVSLFELTHLRMLLLIFPNAFEYFFIFYAIFCLRWDPQQMTKRVAIRAAALIWVVIKLPQEWWLHVAQLDTTDFLKVHVLGVPVSAPWREALTNYQWPIPVILCALAIAAILTSGFVWGLPLRQQARRLAAHPLVPQLGSERARKAFAAEAERILDMALVEKTVLIALLTFIFAQVLPDVRDSAWILVACVAIVVLANTVLIQLLARLGLGRMSTEMHFFATGALNATLFAAFASVLGLDKTIGGSSSIFFVLVLTLFVSLYDQSRQYYLIRSEVADVDQLRLST
jgi:hypothetical protein